MALASQPEPQQGGRRKAAEKKRGCRLEQSTHRMSKTIQQCRSSSGTCRVEWLLPIPAGVKPLPSEIQDWHHRGTGGFMDHSGNTGADSTAKFIQQSRVINREQTAHCMLISHEDQLTVVKKYIFNVIIFNCHWLTAVAKWSQNPQSKLVPH